MSTTPRTAPPLLQVRVIAPTEHAKTVTAQLTATARTLLGPGITTRTQTRTAYRTGYIRVYLTVTRRESP